SGVPATTEEPLPEISGYRIERLLGSGGVGSVYAAVSLATRRRVAIKTLRSLAGRQATERFRQECRALARLSHPGIVQLVETGVATGSVTYLVMEFIEGLPLDLWTVEHQPSPAMSVGLVRSMLSALSHAHEAVLGRREPLRARRDAGA
ncbi:MAG: protein kinase domain-containing protein, partial [Planctomycetota bacterium]